MGLDQESDIWEKTWRRWGCQSRKHLWEVFPGGADKRGQTEVCGQVQGGTEVSVNEGEWTGVTCGRGGWTGNRGHVPYILACYWKDAIQGRSDKDHPGSVLSRDTIGTGGSENKAVDREVLTSDQIPTYREGRINRISWQTGFRFQRRERARIPLFDLNVGKDATTNWDGYEWPEVGSHLERRNRRSVMDKTQSERSIKCSSGDVK